MTPHEELALRVKAVEDEQKSMRADLKANTDITKTIKDDTADLLEFVRACAGLVPLAKWVGRIAQWIAPLVVAGAAVWALVKDKKL